ncbi:MurR/RpiR family transcriptional regulator [Anaerostipes butyraticus]|uniref:MurR/RpiR family transcriptional regulator n=1 Tax=Anaerostipes butyraticus TaxID=645466 RepID=UPI0023A7E517|nr:MurR/RpiR family transcriptional regulator [Anaerostipes butyraticus]
MILEQLREARDFTGSEQMIAEYVLKHTDSLEQLTAADLAKKAFTSKATVIRLCKKPGTKGYRDFNRKVGMEALEEKRVNALLEAEPFNENSSYEDIVQKLPSIYDSAVANTRLSLDRNVIRRVVNRIRQADKVEFYGMGITYTTARAAAFKLMTIGIESSACNGLNEHNIIVSKKKKKRVAVILSFTGSNPGMVSAAEFLREQGVYVVGMGGGKEELRAYCNEFIPIYTAKQIMSMEVITSITSANYILDVIFISLIVDNYQENVDAAVAIYKMRHGAEEEQEGRSLKKSGPKIQNRKRIKSQLWTSGPTGPFFVEKP